MSILASSKSKIKDSINKLTNFGTSGAGSGFGLSGSLKPTPLKPSVQSVVNTATGGKAGPSSKAPSTTASVQSLLDSAKKAQAMLDQYKSGQLKSGTANSSSIPSPSKNQFYIDAKTGKASYGPTGTIDVQGAIDKAEGGRAGGKSKAGAPKTSSLSLTSPDYGYGLGEGISLASFSSDSGSSRTSSRTSGGGTGSGTTSVAEGSSGGGAGGAVSSREDYLAKKAEEAAKIAEEAGILAMKDESAAKDAVTSDTPIAQEEADALAYLKTPVDNSSLALFNEELKQAKKDYIDAQSTINKDFESQKTGMESKQTGEVGQASMGIATAGGYLGFSGSGQAVMLSLAESHRAELTSLEAKRQQALNEARVAAANRRFDIVRLKADEIQRIDQETYERKRDYNDEVKKEADKQVEEAKTLKTQSDVIRAIKGGAKNAQGIFESLKGTVPLDEINDVLTGITKSATGSFKFSADETAKLLGAGMNSDDISTLLDVVNESGYTEELRAQLTPLERAAADKVFRAKTQGDDSVQGYSVDGTAITGTTMQVIDGFTSLKELTPTVREKVKKELYALGFGESTPPAWFDAEFMVGAGFPTEVGDSLMQYAVPDLTGLRIPKTTKPFKTVQKDAWNKFRLQKIGNSTSGSDSISGSGDSSWDTMYDEE